MMNIWTPHAAAHFCCPVIRIVLLLRHDFLRALVAADDFDRGGRRGRWGRLLRPAAAEGPDSPTRHGAPARRYPSATAGRMPYVGGAVLSSGLRSAS